MTKIYTLTLAPRWIAPRKPHRSTRKANFAAARRYLNRRRRDQRGPRRDLSAAKPPPFSRSVALPASILPPCWPMSRCRSRPSKPATGRGKTCTSTYASGEQYRFVMPGAALTDDEFRRLEEKVLTIEPGSLLVISGSLPPY